MKIIRAIAGESVMVDDEDFAEFGHLKWRVNRFGYVSRIWRERVNGRRVGHYVSLHRQVMKDPKGLHVDHKDGDKLNCQKSNLRACNNSLNQANRHIITGKSSFRGVCWNKQVKKWQAQIKVEGKTIYLGLFAVELDAAEAYAKAAKQHFGEFANERALELVQKARAA